MVATLPPGPRPGLPPAPQPGPGKGERGGPATTNLTPNYSEHPDLQLKGLTGLEAGEWDTLIAQLTALHEGQRETDLNKRRGHRPRIKGDGTTGRRPQLTLADRLLAALLHNRLALPQVAIAALFGVRPETINRRLRDIRHLLERVGRTIEPADLQLVDLDDLYALAQAAAITIPKEIKATG